MADDNARVPQRVAPGGLPLSAAVNHLGSSSTPAPTKTVPARPDRSLPPETKDSLREIIETVVFVVVLVLLLKSFVAEAFVIPTGSMAETLWGYQKVVECPKCHYSFPVNCSSEVDPQPPAERSRVTGCTCPNCRYAIDFSPTGPNPSWNTGDRVLVAKFVYDSHLRSPERFDVVVFKYPEKPQKDHVPMNYIKRLIGLPGETIAIWYGQLYASDGLRYDDSEVKKVDRWQKMYTHENDPRALRAFEEGQFRIIRKAPDKMLALRRLVYDNEHQDPTLPPRWVSKDGTWQAREPKDPRVFRHAARPDDIGWLRYQHLLRDAAGPRLITDFMGYNTWMSDRGGHSAPPPNWVGDLMVECDVEIEQAQGLLILELSKGVDRFQARFDLSSGMCTLTRRGEAERTENLDSRPTTLKKPGTYRLRFANVDERLTVWVDNSLPFGDGITYKPLQQGPFKNDLEPASIGVQGAALQVSKLRLWRDTYYTSHVGFLPEGDARLPFDEAWGDPDQWEPLRKLSVRTLYVQPEPHHYLCLGDNSPESSDGRTWGLVPERLLLGRALMVYYPFWPFSEINRAGPIK